MEVGTKLMASPSTAWVVSWMDKSMEEYLEEQCSEILLKMLLVVKNFILLKYPLVLAILINKDKLELKAMGS